MAKLSKEYESIMDEDTFAKCKKCELDCLYFEPFYIVFVLLFYFLKIKYSLHFFWIDYSISEFGCSLIFITNILVSNFLITRLIRFLYCYLVIDKKYGLKLSDIVEYIDDQTIRFFWGWILILIQFIFLYFASSLDKDHLFISFFIILFLSDELLNCFTLTFILDIICNLILKWSPFGEFLPKQSKLRVKIEKLAESIGCQLKNILAGITFRIVGM
jgi:hypothetical protein